MWKGREGSSAFIQLGLWNIWDIPIPSPLDGFYSQNEEPPAQPLGAQGFEGTLLRTCPVPSELPLQLHKP